MQITSFDFYGSLYTAATIYTADQQKILHVYNLNKLHNYDSIYSLVASWYTPYTVNHWLSGVFGTQQN